MVNVDVTVMVTSGDSEVITSAQALAAVFSARLRRPAAEVDALAQCGYGVMLDSLVILARKWAGCR